MGHVTINTERVDTFLFLSFFTSSAKVEMNQPADGYNIEHVRAGQ